MPSRKMTWDEVVAEMVKFRNERDRAVELLRRWDGSFKCGMGPCGADDCAACDTVTFLAEQEPCPRCNDEGRIEAGRTLGKHGGTVKHRKD